MALRATVFIQGKIVSDIKREYTRTQKVVTTVRVATKNYFFNEETKQWEEPKRPVFLDLEAWGERAEQIYESFQRGDVIEAYGTIEQERWEKGGVPRERTYVALSAMPFVVEPAKTGHGKYDGPEEGNAPGSGIDSFVS